MIAINLKLSRQGSRYGARSIVLTDKDMDNAVLDRFYESAEGERVLRFLESVARYANGFSSEQLYDFAATISADLFNTRDIGAALKANQYQTLFRAVKRELLRREQPW